MGCSRVVVGGGWLSAHRRGGATSAGGGARRCARCPVWVGRSGLVRGPGGQDMPPSLWGDGRGRGGWEAMAAQGFPIGALYLLHGSKIRAFSFHCDFKKSHHYASLDRTPLRSAIMSRTEPQRTLGGRIKRHSANRHHTSQHQTTRHHTHRHGTRLNDRGVVSLDAETPAHSALTGTQAGWPQREPHGRPSSRQPAPWPTPRRSRESRAEASGRYSSAPPDTIRGKGSKICVKRL